ncbi:MAG: hypothetical protein JJT93_05345 [Gammaproteobacteria bacterium]|nr:hypothetical protein [Gammaproteobacteria bacterium]
MKVKTPAMKLDVRVDQVVARDGLIVLEGVAGMLPCQTELTPREVRRLLLKVLRPRVLWLALTGRDGSAQPG